MSTKAKNKTTSSGADAASVPALATVLNHESWSKDELTAKVKEFKNLAKPGEYLNSISEPVRKAVMSCAIVWAGGADLTSLDVYDRSITKIDYLLLAKQIMSVPNWIDHVVVVLNAAVQLGSLKLSRISDANQKAKLSGAMIHLSVGTTPPNGIRVTYKRLALLFPSVLSDIILKTGTIKFNLMKDYPPAIQHIGFAAIIPASAEWDGLYHAYVSWMFDYFSQVKTKDGKFYVAIDETILTNIRNSDTVYTEADKKTLLAQRQINKDDFTAYKSKKSEIAIYNANLLTNDELKAKAGKSSGN